MPDRRQAVIWTNDGVAYWHMDRLVQERRNSIANAQELRLSCTNPSIYVYASLGLNDFNAYKQKLMHAILFNLAAQRA